MSITDEPISLRGSNWSDDLSLPERPLWQQYANCRGMDPALFFPPRGKGNGNAGAARQIRQVCASCEVRSECLEFGLNERDGYWGGLSGNERQRVRVARRRSA